MLVMIQSDFITMKNSALQLLGIGLIVAIFIWLGVGEMVAGLAAVAAMIPFMYIFSIAAYDEMGGWEKFRLTLPITRRQVVFGRYAGILIVVVFSNLFLLVLTMLIYLVGSFLPEPSVVSGEKAWLSFMTNDINPIVEESHTLVVSSIMLFTAALTMPLFMRYGMTKGTRIAPLAIVMIMVGVLYFSDHAVDILPALEVLFLPTADQVWQSMGMSAALFCGVLVLFVISAFVAAKLYEKRQF